MTLDFYDESLVFFQEGIHNTDYFINFQTVSHCMQAIGYIYGPLTTAYRLLDGTRIPQDSCFDYMYTLFDSFSPDRLKGNGSSQDQIIKDLISETHKKGDTDVTKGNSLYFYFKMAIKHILEINYKNNYTGLPSIAEKHGVNSILQLNYLIRDKQFPNLRKIHNLDDNEFKKELNWIVEESKKGTKNFYVSDTDFTSKEIEIHEELVNYSIERLKTDSIKYEAERPNKIREAVLNALLKQENANSPLTILFKNCIDYFERILLITYPGEEDTAKVVSDKIKNELDMMIYKAKKYMELDQSPVEIAQEVYTGLKNSYQKSLVELVRLFCVEYLLVIEKRKEKEVNPVAIVFLSNLKAMERILNLVVAPIPVNVNESDLTFSIVNFVFKSFSYQSKGNKDEFYEEMSEKLKNEQDTRSASFRNLTMNRNKIKREAFYFVEDMIYPFSITSELIDNQIASLNPQPVQDSNEAVKPNTSSSSSKESEPGWCEVKRPSRSSKSKKRLGTKSH